MIILASASPRRAELLRNANIPFAVDVANVPEIVRPGESPSGFAVRAAREKAQAVAVRRAAADMVLAADTIVVVDEQILGKPADSADARRMLRLLSARSHQVITGVCLIAERKELSQHESTTVTFSEMTEQEIEDYIATGEPMDKAGAYGIQGIASRWAMRLEGCYFNVVGLPVPLVYRMLREVGANLD
jgi:septum formation protein